MKSQITVENSKHQIPNHKFEIQNLKRFWSFGHCILEFICNLYFVIWNFKRFGNWNLFGILDLNFGISRIGHWYLFVICILLFGIFGVKDASAAVSNLGLVGYWSMNEGTGTVAGDFSGNKNTATFANLSIDEFDSTESWTETQMTGSVSGGAYQGAITNVSDPHMDKTITTFDEGSRYLEIRYKNYSSGPTSIRVYYRDGADCTVDSETCAQSFSVLTDTNWNILQAEITDPEWTDNDGNITQLRFDFDSASVTGTIQLDYIRFVNRGWKDGKRGKAIDFGGGYLTLNASIVDSSDSTFTYAFWFNSNVAMGGTPFSEATTGINGCSTTNGVFSGLAASSIEIAAGTNGVSVHEHDAAHAPTVASYQATLNGWHHVVVVSISTTDMRLYVDGVQRDTALNTAKTRVLNATGLAFVSACDPDRFFNGLLDEMRIYNRALSAAEVQALYKSGAQKFTAPPTNLGLVGYWSMNEGAGTVAGDGSGNGNRGILTNGPTWVDGKRGKAINFDGGDDYVDASLVSSKTNNFSFAFWLKVEVTSDTRGTVFFNGSGTNGYGFVAGSTDGGNTATFFFLAQSIYWLNTSVGWTPNAWQHIVGTLDASNVWRLYRNGNLVFTSVAQSALNTPTIRTTLGAESSGGSSIAHSLDEVRVYNRALSAAEIQALYNSGAQKFTAPPTNLGLVGYWSMNEGTGTVAGDGSGNGNRGTLTGGPTWVDGKRGKALSFDGG